ncbi:MAG: ATP-dependent DNA ligase [Candidatus Marsarchaeota archaeon]|nr:ATP-dependent DNA ligase [Candidatus Marsarchaeota archaeon]MCL5413250.1 ATP-dependent DNA ligase [Candidatus Marsarchaeota archaeon]
MLFEEAAKYYERLENTSSRLGMVDILSEMLSHAKPNEIKDLIYLTQGVLAPPFEGLQIGIAEKFAESAIAMSSGYSKEDVVASFRKTGDLGLTSEEFVKKGKLKTLSKRHFESNYVFESMHKIAKTSGTGSQDTKIKILVELLASSSALEARYIIRFALGRLRLGAGDATILEALSKAFTGDRKAKPELENAYNICSDLGKVGEIISEKGMAGISRLKVTLFSPIRPALAERLPTSEQILEKMNGRCAVESKYDGFRVQVHLDRKNNKVAMFSRNLENTTLMFPDIEKAALSEVSAKEAIFEGEALAYDETTGEFRPFQETIQRKRKHGIAMKSTEFPLHLFSFDLMYLDGEDYLSRPYEERRKKLESIIKGNGLIRFSDRIIATTSKQIDKYFEEAVENGLEGIVAKEPNSVYVAGARKFSWIKLKRSYKGELSDTVDLVILGYFLGKGQRAEFGFGGLLTGVYNEKKDVFETLSKIGTGFSEEQMRMFNDTLKKIKVSKKPVRVDAIVSPDFWVEPKYVVTVRADEITKSPMHTCGKEGGKDETGYALRFPRLVSDGIRKDKSPADATTTNEIIEMFGQQKKVRLEG